MYNPNNDGPTSPMKKLKILSEKQNVLEKVETPTLASIKETMAPPTTPSTPKEAQEVVAEVDPNAEPLLEESMSSYVIFPINHADMWSMYKHLVDNFWSVTETLQHFDALQLNYNEVQFMKFFSSIFASPQSRGLVNDNFAEEFCKVIQVTEAKFFYGHQLFVQNIHYELYNNLLDKFAPNNEEKEKLFKIVENFDAVANKRAWVSQWKHAPFGDQLAASACLHGLMFCATELIRDWLKARMKNNFNHELVEIFDKMILDQNLQRDFDCIMISHLKNKPSMEKMLEMINESAKLEFDFLVNGLKIDLVEYAPEEIILLIDRKTKELKQKMFNTEKKKQTNELKKVASVVCQQSYEENNAPKENNYSKLVLDEDF